MGYVYLIKDTLNNIYRIGVTKDLNKRLRNLQTGNSNYLTLLSSYQTKYPFRLETMLHNKFKEYRILNEWYELPKRIVNNFNAECESLDNIITSLKDNPFFNKKLK